MNRSRQNQREVRPPGRLDVTEQRAQSDDAGGDDPAPVRDLEQARRELARHAVRQAAVAELAEDVLRGIDPDSLLEKACARLASVLEIEFVKVLEWLPGTGVFFLRAGLGWKEGLVGSARVEAGLNSQSGFTYLKQKRVIVKDLAKETRFIPTPLLQEHGVVSGLSVFIPGKGSGWGVLGVHSNRGRRFSDGDILFVQSVASLLANAMATKEIEVERRRFRHILENTTDFVAVWKADLKSVFLNRAARGLLGFDEEYGDSGELPPSAFYTRETMKEIVEPAFRIAAEVGFWLGQTRMVDRFGAEIVVSQEILAHKDREGNIEFFSMIGRDVTDEQEQQVQLLRACRLLELQQEASPDGILVEDCEHRLISANPCFIDMWGIPAGDLPVGQEGVIPGRVAPKVADPEGFRERIDAFLSSGEMEWRSEVALADGRRFEGFCAAIYREPEDEIYGWVWFFRNLGQNNA